MFDARAPSASNDVSKNPGEVFERVLQEVCARMFADTGNNLKFRLEQSLNIEFVIYAVPDSL